MKMVTWCASFVSIRFALRIDWVESMVSAALTGWIRGSGFGGIPLRIEWAKVCSNRFKRVKVDRFDANSNSVDSRELSLRESKAEIVLMDSEPEACVYGFEELSVEGIRRWWSRGKGSSMDSNWFLANGFEDGFADGVEARGIRP